MKKLQYIKYLLLTLFAIMIADCTDFDELNTNPTQSMNMDPNLQIPYIQLSQTNRTDDWHRLFIYPGGFMNHWTQDWAVVEYGGKGKKNYNYFSLYWDMYYLNAIKNAVDLEMRTREIPEYTNINAMARILKVQNFLRLTDIYGDMPYFDAGKAYYSGIFKPKYDTQEEIYNDFFKELKEAAAALSAEYPKATADLYYNGDIALWKKFANSFRLRIAMRLVKVDPQRAKEEIESAINPTNGGVFTSNSDICFVKHDYVESQVMPSAGNGIANILGKRINFFRLSEELIGTMEDMGDPRILYYGGSYLDDDVRTDITALVYAKLGGTTYRELTVPAQTWTYELVGDAWRGPILIEINGQEREVTRLEQVLRPSKFVTNFGAPYIHLSYAEVEFLLAEAIHRGYISGNKQEHFKNGLEAAVNQWSLFDVRVPADAATTYSSKNPLRQGTELEQIGAQLWILNFLDPIEAWSNWRRMGQPDIKFYNNYPNENQSNGEIPRRIEYPLSEQINNPDEWSKAVDRLGGQDDWLRRIWWDKK
jgi:hypothetical protein